MKKTTTEEVDIGLVESINYDYMLAAFPETRWLLDNNLLPLNSGPFVTKNGNKGRTIVVFDNQTPVNPLRPFCDTMVISSFIDHGDKITTQESDGDLSHPSQVIVSMTSTTIYFGSNLSFWEDGPSYLSIGKNKEYGLYWIDGGSVSNNTGAAKICLYATNKTILNVFKKNKSHDWLTEDKFKEQYLMTHMREFVPETYESAVAKWCPWIGYVSPHT